MWRSRWRCVIKPACSFSFLLSINIFVWQNVLYFLDAPRISQIPAERLSKMGSVAKELTTKHRSWVSLSLSPHTRTHAHPARQVLLDNTVHYPATAINTQPSPSAIPMTAYCYDEAKEIWRMDHGTQGESLVITSHEAVTWTDVIRGVWSQVVPRSA